MEIVRDDIELPIIDLLWERSKASKLMVEACEEFGFFKVINHGVKQEIISGMEEETRKFFSKPVSEKKRAGPPDPYGYGSHNIGLHGDVGEVEYLLLHANPHFVSHNSKHLSDKFKCRVSRYVESVRELACEILDLMEEGLLGRGQHTSLLSGLVKDVHNDSLLRLNHYPPAEVNHIGFGAHTDPQMLSILRSNACFGGLQISVKGGVWVPVDPHPASAFCVNVGDVLQAMTNGRFGSVKHRAVVDRVRGRTSIVYFAAPPLHANISCLCLPSPSSNNRTPPPPPQYRSFSWGEYKHAAYTRKQQQVKNSKGRELLFSRQLSRNVFSQSMPKP